MMDFTMTGLLALMFLFTSANGFLLTGKCSFSAKCTCVVNRVDCSYRYLTVLPTFNATKVETDYLGINHNYISSIPANAFSVFFQTPHHLLIRLDDNRISNIDGDAFSGIPDNSTLDIYLNQNFLANIPAALQKIHGLTSLYIQDNPIKSVGALPTIGPSLQVFRLSFKYLYSWPDEIKTLTNLRNLQVDDMLFQNLDLDAFAGLEKLTSLSIKSSNLERVPDAICQLKDLQLFYFIGNKALNSSLPLFGSCNSVLDSVYYVDLSSNNLRQFPNVFQAFPSVTRLKLSDNQIHYIESSILPSNIPLERLDMTMNHMQRIPANLHKLALLKRLYLAGNDITTVEDCDLSGLKSLQYLSIDNNPVEYISENSFHDNSNLNLVYLSQTHLRQIPESVGNLPHLSVLDMTKNSIICDCKLSNLKSLLRVDVQGTCSSSETIREFMTTSLSSCP